MDPYGLCLEESFRRSGCYFSMQNLLLLADQLLSRVEFIHSRNIFHGSLTPWSFAFGRDGWQSQQVLLVDFDTQSGPEVSAQSDIYAVGRILTYFYNGSYSWEQYQRFSTSDMMKNTAPVFSAYLDSVSACDPVDYDRLRSIFREAHQDLAIQMEAALGLRGPRAIQVGVRPNSSVLSTMATRDLFNILILKLARAGGRATGATTTLMLQTCTQLLEHLEEILDVYIVLLSRDRFSPQTQEGAMQAFHLPNCLWRDLRWFLSHSDHATCEFRLAFIGKIYKFIAILYEAVPSYRPYWTEYLLILSHARTKAEPSCGKSAWTQTEFYWRNLLKKQKGEL
ncbi:hypothetical protein Plec18167_001889 [Paecilomyces lecythidis]|uniref:Uncharacterized protein n=1 Tax=Paecilomyces lecythidis TaxID=3004212 RepID=A0ABR3YBJ6_9EURO